MKKLAILFSVLAVCVLAIEAEPLELKYWPLWPDPSKVTPVQFEPIPHTSVGRDAVAQVYFKYPSSYLQRVWGADLKIWVVDGEDLRPVSISFNYGSGDLGLAYMDNYAEVKGFSANQVLKEDLKVYAVHPEYKNSWFAIEDIDYPNQDFFDSWFSSWRSFLVGDTEKEGKVLADSGHAPPLLVWKKNPWLTKYVDSMSYPSSWGEDPWLFLPANDGLLHAFEINSFAATAVRRWSLMPLPAFQLAVYQEHLRRTKGYYPRITLLDGPCEVYDVENINGEWKRVLIGTTGAGSALMNKAKDAWKTEYNNSSVAPNANAPSLGSGRHFGIYAIDVTDPKSPKPMWSKSNLYWKRGNSDENSPDLDVDYVVARPLIGFTEDDGTRHWHAILLGVDSQGGYRWYDFDPITGEEKGKGVFSGSESGSKSKSESESESVDLIDGVPSELYYPSRILAAFPPNGASPVLSDVYAYLSNGCLYYWNVQRGEPPKKLLKLYVQSNNEGLSPVGDFDIAYVRENGELHTYFAATLYRGLPGGNPHDSFILFVMDLTSIGDFRNPSSDIEPQELKMQGALGQDGDVLIFKNDEASYIPLKTSKGNAPKFNRLVSNPVFVGGKLYLAAYSPESNMSRLYTLDAEIFQKDGKGGKKKGLEEGVDYLDFQGEAFESAVFGSDGRLYVATEEGETYAFGEPPRMRTLYWRVKN
ncbi:MAG TPA: hypothetical protein GXX52_04760 [Synergistaceae bacterium]|nr:hypothetical protein [Synergistaceae bacterium]